MLLLAFMATFSGGAARRESITIDEVPHTAAGVAYWQKLDMRMNEEHPPLSKLIAGLPLALRGVHADYTHTSWTFSGNGPFNQYLGEWTFGYWFLMQWNDPRPTIWLARIAMLSITLLLGWVIYLLGNRLGGPWGGLLCLACYATTPAFLAFGPLVITDIVITLFWLLTVWQMANLWRFPTRGTLVRFGLTFACALLSKFSAGLLLFVFPAIALSLRIWRVPEQPSERSQLRAWRRSAWWNMFKGTAWAGLFVYLVYFVFSWNQPTNTFDAIPNFPASAVLRRLLMPPLIYLKGVAGFAMSAGSRPTYILGHSYPHGVWFYFPVIFALKSQFAFLLLLLLAVVAAIILRRSSAWNHDESLVPRGLLLNWRCLWVSLSVYVVVCMLNRLDISVRHFLIAVALIILLLAPLPRALRRLRTMQPRLATIGSVGCVVLVLCSIGSAVRAFPYYFPYLNWLSAGKPGYLLVNDSNLDWNQGLPSAEEYAQQHGLQHYLLDAYTFSDAGPYVTRGEAWNCQKAAPSDGGRWAIVSGNNLADTRNCLWLMQYKHEALDGGSMYAVQLPAVIPAAGALGGPPLPQDYHFLGLGFNQEDIREIFGACIRDPAQLEPTFQRMMEMAKQMREQQQKH